MKYLLGIFFILMVSQVCAVCESGQIDVNSASLEKLDELTGIGPVKSQAIIDYRDSEWFDSVDDLIDVYGIGPATLQKIKDQGLACVDGQATESPASGAEEPSNERSEEDFVSNFPENRNEGKIVEIVELETIKLNALDTKDIKSEDDKKNLDKSDWAKYGFVGFCVLLGFLFILKKRKVRSEFD